MAGGACLKYVGWILVGRRIALKVVTLQTPEFDTRLMRMGYSASLVEDMEHMRCTRKYIWSRQVVGGEFTWSSFVEIHV